MSNFQKEKAERVAKNANNNNLSQAAHLEQTIQSVLLAADGCGAELEYVVIDGGSTDGSREILERYAPQFARRMFQAS